MKAANRWDAWHGSAAGPEKPSTADVTDEALAAGWLSAGGETAI